MPTGKKQGRGTFDKSSEKENGSTPEEDTAESIPNSGLSFATLLGCLVVATISFGAGVFTPILSNWRNIPAQSRKLATNTDRVQCFRETLAQYLHDEPVVGMHLLCLDSRSNTITTYKELYEKSIKPIPIASSWNELKVALQDTLDLQTMEFRQPWAIFTSDGSRMLVSATDAIENPKALLHELKQAGMALIMEGGNWLWPGVRIGFRRTIDLSAVPGTSLSIERRNATLETLSLNPLVLSVEGFLTDEECDFIQMEAMPQLRYSEVTLMDKDAGRPSSDFRTSQSTFVRSNEGTMKQVDYRTASLVRIPRSHQEHVQVLRYGGGEHYSAHHDYFDPSLYQNDLTTLSSIEHGRRNRLATVFWYLSDVEQGGETNFPLFNNSKYPSRLDKCTQGLMVKPVRGKVIIFYSLKADGDMDPLSLHAACQVEEGVKFAANKWVWNAPMGHLPVM